MHQARDPLLGVGIAVVVDALDERRGAVADADDRHPHPLGLVAPGAVLGGGAVAVVCAHAESPPLSSF